MLFHLLYMILTNVNDYLEEMAKTIYDYWFVQFDFPNENGEPYKSSGGEMMYSPKLDMEIPAFWEITTLTHNMFLYLRNSIFIRSSLIADTIFQ